MSTRTNKVIGRGLGALLSSVEDDINEASSIAEIKVSDIDPNPDQPRRDFDKNAIEELAISMKAIGLVQPITVQKKDDGRYFIIAGERRFRAAKSINLQTLPAYVIDISPRDIMELALVENIQRQDLNAIEVALSLESIMKQKSITHEELSKIVGKSRATVTNYLRLLNLPAQIQLGITNRLITMGHAKALLSISDTEEQISIYNKVVSQKLSVRDIEKLSYSRERTIIEPRNQSHKINEDFTILSNRLSNTFSTKVSIEQNDKGKGKLTISFSSEEDLERILHILEKLQH